MRDYKGKRIIPFIGGLAIALGAMHVAYADTLTTLASFDGSNGANPYAGLTIGADGNLYGTTGEGGADGEGTVYEIAAGSNTITTLASFDVSNGFNPDAGLTIGADGNLYGTTTFGGADGGGTVYEIAAGSNTITTLASFDGSNGVEPYAGLTIGADGNLYGTTTFGGADGGGTVYEIAAGSNTITTLASFDGSNGLEPFAGLTIGADGNLYGTTTFGGADGGGTVYEIAAGSNTITTLASFDGSNGVEPYAGLTIGADGNLYGTTLEGGADDEGTVYEIAAGSNTITTLASFDGSNGVEPYAGLTIGADGNLYGTTVEGGADDEGTVYEIAAGSNTITTLASFDGSNGVEPYAGLTIGADGNLYGTTVEGGADDEGTVFELTDSGFVSTPLPPASIGGFVLIAGLAIARRIRGRKVIA